MLDDVVNFFLLRLLLSSGALRNLGDDRQPLQKTRLGSRAMQELPARNAFLVIGLALDDKRIAFGRGKGRCFALDLAR